MGTENTIAENLVYSFPEEIEKIKRIGKMK